MDRFFKKLRSYDLMAPLSICIFMLCFDIIECIPDTPYRQFYFEFGIEAMDADNEYIYDGAMKAGLIERGVIDIVTFAISGIMPENAEGLREAICCLFEDHTNLLKYLSADQFRLAHKFAFQRRNDN